MRTPWLPHAIGSRALVLSLAAFPAALATPTCATRQGPQPSVARSLPEGVSQAEGLSRTEFAALVGDISEEGGYFHSDNFTSNETSYLHVVDKLRELGVSGGAYVGVGPEQNFTYIAKVRPRIAFVLDIRRQAVVQHLLYKALFHLSPDRAQFLSRLLSRPLAAASSASGSRSIESLLEYLRTAPAPAEAYTANLAAVRQMIDKDFGIPLSDRDQEQLAYVYSTFHEQGLGIAFRFGQTSYAGYARRFPGLDELILERDQKGSLGNFLASDEDYEFVRGLQLSNRVVPVVGDFAGKRALAAIGDYLRTHGLVVSAFYTSNVEQFLFQNAVFGAFVENVRRLPVDEKSVFIRAVPTRGQPHPANVPGHHMTTLLQRIPVFLKDFEAGAYADYRDLVTTHFIAGEP